MNHAQLEAIRRRAQNASTTRPDHPAVADREQLLAELDRKWRLLEDADAKINKIRREIHNAEDRGPASEAAMLLGRLRAIVGPR